jgi:hypothetical protein
MSTGMCLVLCYVPCDSSVLPPKKFYLMSKTEIHKFSKNVGATSELQASADVIKEFSYQRHAILDGSVISKV